MNVFSYSRLKRYSECPQSFLFKYILEMEEPVSEPLALGKAVHAAIESFLKVQQAGERADMAECVAAAVAEAPVPLSYDETLRICLNPAIREQTFCYGPAEIEQRFDVPLGATGLYTLQGTVDYAETGLADGSVYLIDWKTNRVKYSADSLQLRLYAGVLAERFGAKKVLARLIFLRYQSHACVEETVIGENAMEEARRWAFQTAQEIDVNMAALKCFESDAATLFPARPCASCQTCGYAFQCVQGMVLQPAHIASQQQAEVMAGEVLRLEAAVSSMKEALKSWVKSTGQPVNLPGGSFRFIPATSWNFNESGLKNLCDRINYLGENYWRYLSIGAAQLKKLNLEEEELVLYGKKKHSETFRFIRSKEGAEEGGETGENHQKPSGSRPAENDASAAA